MSNRSSLFLNNPELRRNFRIELSPKRLVTATIITAVFALIVLPSLTQNRPAGGSRYITLYLMAILWSQGITLTLGGAISCWRAVRRERELNTFDYQRITRLSPLELAIGKLFGAPALAYFVTLCLVPPAVVSAAGSGGVAVDFLARSYVLLFTGALVIHAFALMISTISDKGGMSSGLLLLMLFQLVPVISLLFSVSPTTSIQNAGRTSAVPFYGIAFPPTLLWAALELGFAAWLMLAVVRNIKLGLEAMQLFSIWEGWDSRPIAIFSGSDSILGGPRPAEIPRVEIAASHGCRLLLCRWHRRAAKPRTGSARIARSNRGLIRGRAVAGPDRLVCGCRGVG